MGNPVTDAIEKAVDGAVMRLEDRVKLSIEIWALEGAAKAILVQLIAINPAKVEFYDAAKRALG